MVIQVWRNKEKVKEEDPDYIVLQKQRTGIEGKGYETVQIGQGWKTDAPDEQYIHITIDGLTNNKPK